MVTPFSDVTLTEERMQEIIRHRREIRGTQIRPVFLVQFARNVEFYIRIYLLSLSASTINSRSLWSTDDLVLSVT